MRLDWIFLPRENPCAKFYIIIIIIIVKVRSICKLANGTFCYNSNLCYGSTVFFV